MPDERLDLVALVGRAYARERYRGADDLTAFRAANRVLGEVDPDDASPIRCSRLIAEAAERFGRALYRPPGRV